ncbi:MAG: phenylalanine--tRNA ligase subunit beta [Clostridia bacterium]|nr:phenylalanine--tRNA ligase subunit beta [Clostridia bacterium]MBQ5819827.1 phenylalanine--tRNA ligase subunit beta [Clostridia bacterium]
MNVSYRWLKEYTPVDAADKVVAHELNMTGTEIKGFRRMDEGISNVVVGKILSIEQHPNADKLVVCMVDVGQSEPTQIVTGAKNMKEGDLVPVALHKSTLPGGVKIERGKLRGVVSNGMFCGVEELGLTVNDYPDAISDGLLILKEGVVGRDIREQLGIDDTVFEADIMTNRPDCLSMIGVAREAAGTFRLPLTVNKPVVKGEGESAEKYLKVTIKDKDLCPRYSARIVTDVTIAPSPMWMVERLRACGIRSINNIVDITNYVMMEYGQPMHAFDYACLDGGHITVRRANDGEIMKTLDDQDRALDGEMLVIADDKKPVAVAGVMGGANSEITDETKTVVFESANFFGASIRHTAKKLGMRTEASAHFEKNIDPQMTLEALDRACQLVEELGAGKVSPDVIDEDYSDKTKRTIPLSADWIRHYINVSISDEEMKALLERVGFEVDLTDGTVTVPSFRSDVENKYDLSEEVARFYGYDNIPSFSFSADVKSGGLTEEQIFERDLRIGLRAVGFSEIETYSFVSPKGFDKILLPEDSAKRNCLKIKNPLGEDTSVMRTTSLPSMLEVLASNYNNRIPSAHLYEVATVYIKDEDETKLPAEPKVVTIGAYGDGIDFYDLKGRIEEMLAALNVANISVRPCKTNPSYHPGRTAELSVDGRVIGVFGQLHPMTVKNFELAGEVYAAELSLADLFAVSGNTKGYAPLPKFPAVTRDLALVCDEAVLSGDIEAKIRTLAGDVLEDVRAFDVYRSAALGEGKKSIAYALTLRDAEKTLQDSDIDPVISAILTGLEADGITLRK